MNSKSKFQLSPRFFSMGLAIAILSLCNPNSETPKGSEEKFSSKKNIPISLSFLDAEFSLEYTDPDKKDRNSIKRTAISNVKVSAIDPLKKVLTPSGTIFKDMNVPGGVMVLYLSNKAELPYQFVVKVEAPGYVTTYKQIKIESDRPCYFPVYMVNFKSSLRSVYNQENIVNIKDSKIEKNVYLGKYGIAEVNIPEQSVFSAKGKKIQGESATIKLSYFIPDSINSVAFPSGNTPKTTLKNKPKMANDEHRNNFTPRPLQSFHILPYCWLTLEMQASNQNITKFEKPINITLNFPDNEPESLNPLNNTLSLWSLSDDGVWKFEQKVEVQRFKDQLFSASFEIDHLTTLVIAYPEVPCTSETLTINYKSNQIQTLCSKLIHYPSGINYGFTSDNNILYDLGNHSISITNVPKNRQLRFVAYDDQTGIGLIRDRVIATSFDCNVLCTEVLNLTLNNGIRKKLKFVKEIASGNELVLCEMPVWFKSCSDCVNSEGCTTDSRAYEFGGYIDSDGQITLSQNVPFNKPICIRLCFSSQVGQIITSEYLDFLVDLRHEPNIESPFIGKIRNSNINLSHLFKDSLHILKISSSQTIVVPINACDE